MWRPQARRALDAPAPSPRAHTSRMHTMPHGPGPRLLLTAAAVVYRLRVWRRGPLCRTRARRGSLCRTLAIWSAIRRRGAGVTALGGDSEEPRPVCRAPRGQPTALPRASSPISMRAGLPRTARAAYCPAACLIAHLDEGRSAAYREPLGMGDSARLSRARKHF
jgi:hypothetical protein